MHHSKDLVFTFILVLIFSSCTVSIYNYSALYYGPLHTTGLFSYYRIMIMFESESLKLQNKTTLSFYSLLLVLSIQMLEWGQVMSIQYLKLNAEFL